MTDFGVICVVHQIDVAAVEFALSLAMAKAEAATVSRSPACVEACRAVAADLGLNVVDEDGRPLNLDIRNNLRRSAATTNG